MKPTFKKSNPIPINKDALGILVISICFLTTLGLAIIGYGLGAFVGNKLECVAIGIGLGLIVTSILLLKTFTIKHDS